MNYLITAGPTREFIDDVRFLSNRSSGRMGYALAAAARAAGHRVVLVSGPTALPAPDGVEFLPVVSAEEMRQVVLKSLPEADIIVMCAAVADYRPERRVSGKMRREPDAIELRLVKNPDIAAEVGARKQGRFLVGFALEAEDALQSARRKMAAKNADAIVLNQPAAMEAETARVHVLTPDGGLTQLGPAPKELIAVELIRIIDSLHGRRSSKP